MYEILILVSALILDIALGEYPVKMHPTVWVGKIINHFKPRLKHRSIRIEYLNGSVFASSLIVSSFILVYYILALVSFNEVLLFIISVFILKSTFAIRSMDVHARSVIDALLSNDIIEARRRVSMIVGRDTSELDEEHILSAVIESIGESTVDGINSPLFYYGVYGVPLAFAYRVINTLDSMLGYRDTYHRYIGYCSARLDTVFNYIPARLTALSIVLASMLLGLDWRNGVRVMLRDRHNTPSKNSGYPMSVLAGALRIRLEKIGYYTLGDPYERIDVKHYIYALRVMKLSMLILVSALVIPLLITRSVLLLQM